VRVAEVRARNLQATLVRALLGSNAVEFDLRRVVGLDDEAEVAVELLDLGEDLLGLRLLRLDGLGDGRLRQRESRQREKQEKECVSSLRSDGYSRIGDRGDARVAEGALGKVGMLTGA